MSWWGKPKDPKPDQAQPEANSSLQKPPSFDPDKLPEREKLPKRLQSIVDKADRDNSFFDDVIDG